jgi:26S proteasome regulatory subunit N11
MFLKRLLTTPDIEDIGQQLIEDNIVAVSRQMIDKEASVPKSQRRRQTNGQSNGDMEVDEL